MNIEIRYSERQMLELTARFRLCAWNDSDAEVIDSKGILLLRLFYVLIETIIDSALN